MKVVKPLLFHLYSPHNKFPYREIFFFNRSRIHIVQLPSSNTHLPNPTIPSQPEDPD